MIVDYDHNQLFLAYKGSTIDYMTGDGYARKNKCISYQD